MQHTTFQSRPRLRRPVLVSAFEGWNDAGEAATSALGFVASALKAEPIGYIDPEEFFDFQAVRPTVQLVDDADRRIDWPVVQILAASLPNGDRDLVLLRGHEPNLRWRTFAAEVMGVASELDVELVVTLGALLADVPHTRPVQVVGSAGDRELAKRLGISTSRYEGPTGILGVIGDAARRAALPAISIWAALPHYVQASPNPRAALALVTKLRELLPLQLDTDSLEDATRKFDETVAEVVAEDPDLLGYVERLEAEADRDEAEAEDDNVLANLPPEELVAEVERFLRDQPGGSRS
jgi:predicted ATP-grasp superfamily ATP-dependent carboligase